VIKTRRNDRIVKVESIWTDWNFKRGNIEAGEAGSPQCAANPECPICDFGTDLCVVIYFVQQKIQAVSAGSAMHFYATNPNMIPFLINFPICLGVSSVPHYTPLQRECFLAIGCLTAPPDNWGVGPPFRWLEAGCRIAPLRDLVARR
jgi:hypothetical protein